MGNSRARLIFGTVTDLEIAPAAVDVGGWLITIMCRVDRVYPEAVISTKCLDGLYCCIPGGMS